ncbi:MAG: hypothetical protein HQL99_10455 [Magnetococcales bacterium]|nr:hypothetical protein [Magnetococcales bacterium]
MAILSVFLVSRELNAGTLIPLLPAYTLPGLGIYAVILPIVICRPRCGRLIDFLVSRFGSQTKGSRFVRSD